ncbi:inward rectifier K+ channel family transporter, partial [Micromonas commoda]
MRGRSLLGLITFDGFTTLVEMPWRYLVVFVASLYIASFLAYAGVWFGISRHLPGCLSGFEDGFNAAVIFSVATQTTIGYGTRSIVGSCRTGTFVLLCQSLTAVFVSALSIGLIFQRIADPKHRTRSVFISDAACISCRDGELTFMFRVGDARDRKVINPNIRACLYTWDGRRTKEGEHLPVVAKPMEIAYQDGHMLLPITITHVIDESSPLYRHTHDSLVACGAEVVVSLEGQIETTGLSFSARQSYLPQEILWSHQFVRII